MKSYRDGLKNLDMDNDGFQDFFVLCRKKPKLGK